MNVSEESLESDFHKKNNKSEMIVNSGAENSCCETSNTNNNKNYNNNKNKSKDSDRKSVEDVIDEAAMNILNGEDFTLEPTTIKSRSGRNKDHVKRPMNAFMVYAQVARKLISKSNSNLQNSEISKRLGELWRRTDDVAKRVFIERAEELRQTHKKEHPDYKYQPRRKKTKSSASSSSSLSRSSSNRNDYHHLESANNGKCNSQSSRDYSGNEASYTRINNKVIPITSSSASVNNQMDDFQMHCQNRFTTMVNFNTPKCESIQTATDDSILQYQYSTMKMNSEDSEMAIPSLHIEHSSRTSLNRLEELLDQQSGLVIRRNNNNKIIIEKDSPCSPSNSSNNSIHSNGDPHPLTPPATPYTATNAFRPQSPSVNGVIRNSSSAIKGSQYNFTGLTDDQAIYINRSDNKRTNCLTLLSPTHEIHLMSKFNQPADSSSLSYRGYSSHMIQHNYATIPTNSSSSTSSSTSFINYIPPHQISSTYNSQLDTDVDPKELEQYLEGPGQVKKVTNYNFKSEDNLLELHPPTVALSNAMTNYNNSDHIIPAVHTEYSNNIVGVDRLGLPVSSDSAASTYFLELPYQYPHNWENYSQ